MLMLMAYMTGYEGSGSCECGGLGKLISGVWL